jgi:hypothetical protein
MQFVVLCADAQGTFQNLDFESATPSTPITGPIIGAHYQPMGLAFPAWTAYVGTVQQTEVLQNNYTLGLASVDLFGPNYSTAGPSPGVVPGTIDGNYSVFLQSGGDPQSSALVGASIEQTGMVPQGSQSLEFEAWQTASTEFSVSFNGNNLSPVVLGTGANYTLYGVNISPYVGQTGSLEFTANYSGTGASWLGLDDIAFSPTAVPEPNPLVLTGVGVLLFTLYRRFAPKQR